VISFRYHVVSIVAVFLALALGVVVGTTALNGPITTNLRQQVDSLKKDRSSLASNNSKLQQQAGNSDQFAQTFGGRIVAGTLKGKNVVIVGMPNASASIKSSIAKQIAAAGGTLAGSIQLTSDYIDPKRTSDITSLVESLQPIGLQLPTTGDAGTLGGALLGYDLLSGKSETTDISTAVAGFTKAQLMTVDTPNVGPADLAVIVGSGTMPAASDSGKAELDMVAQFQLAGGHTVVAGDSASDTGGGLVALVRGSEAVKDTVSSVDDADTSMGQVTTTLALAEAVTGKTGAYGNGPGASSLFPSLPK
jgi:fructose-specific component phosphotransferase system IIB-like protein